MFYTERESIKPREACWFDASGHPIRGNPETRKDGDSVVYSCDVQIGTPKVEERP